MRTALALITVALISLILSCGKPSPTPDPRTDIQLCPDACEHLQEIGCEEGNPINMPDGTQVSCAQFCVDTANSGHWLNPRCLNEIDSCSEIEACGVHEE